MSINKIKIENFTVFKNFEAEFSEGINVFIGENGTGKTHLLKYLYKAVNNKDFKQLSFFDVFNQVETSNTTEKATYIPVKDILTHSKGFLAMASKYREFPFSKEYIDIITKCQEWQLKEIPELAKNILPKLEKMMNGKVVYENEEFYIEKKDGKKIKFDYEAEGYKKIALLWQLLMTENITEGTILLWDEPEANINPKFIPDLVEIILELSRNGVQIFLSTHSYIFAKYIEVRAKTGDKILFHSLYKENDNVLCESNINFKDLKHNIIMDSFEQLLDEIYDGQIGD